MKDWKEQLLDVKRLLQGAFSGKGEKVKKEAERKAADKPNPIDFVPPASWFDEPPEDSPVTRPRPPQRATIEPTKQHPRVITSPLGPRPSDERNPSACIKKCPAAEPKRVDAGTAGKSKKDAAGVPQTLTNNIDVRSAPLSAGPTLGEFWPRIDPNCRMNMPDWAARGMSLDHPDHHGGRAAPMGVRIGVDFGTAFTKVAIRAGVDLVLVDWSSVTGDVSPIGRYVLPGVVFKSLDGEYHWRKDDRAAIVGNLKLPIIQNIGLDGCPTATLAYLALLIRYARAFLYRHQEVGRKLTARSLRWELNIGCPTQPHEKPEVVKFLERIAHTAWRLAATPLLRESDITDAWSRVEKDIGLETDPRVVPEFVAQIAGYLRSPQVSEGLHALIDIGAATLDVATFNVVLGKGLPRIPIFFSTVHPLGTHYLNHNRHSRLGLDLEWDDSAPVESVDVFARLHGKRIAEVKLIDADFKNSVEESISRVIDKTRTNRRGDPRSSAWSEGLPIFVTGGGSSSDLYRQAISEVLSRIKQCMGPMNHFRFIELDPRGEMPKKFGREAGCRLTVAIGLTQDSDNIARIIPHRDIEPISLPLRRPIDHTDLYGDR